MGYFDFATLASRFYPNTTRTSASNFNMLVDWIRYLYGRQYPMAPLRISQFTMLRHPEQRLVSMYYYDRYAARQAPWRKEFVAQRGNVTWNECWEEQEEKDADVPQLTIFQNGAIYKPNYYVVPTVNVVIRKWHSTRPRQHYNRPWHLWALRNDSKNRCNS